MRQAWPPSSSNEVAVDCPGAQTSVVGTSHDYLKLKAQVSYFTFWSTISLVLDLDQSLQNNFAD